MIALIQRVSKGSVMVDNHITSSIGRGYVILLGIFDYDTDKDIDILVPKIVNLRIMSDKQHKMNKSIHDVQGEILLVSQFTLCADTRKGRRPSFVHAMEPKKAKQMYQEIINRLKETGLKVQTGKFGAMMEVEIINDGPVTIILNSGEL